MIILNTDLDNTLIYSYKRDIGEDKRNVEIYEGRQISFITNRTYELLNKIKEKVLIVPTTTRTIQQYERIDLGIGKHKYALVCNGGILLVDGERDENWYKDSLKLVENSALQLEKAMESLGTDKRRTFELRFIEKLFVFTKCDEPENVVEDLKKLLDTTVVDIFNNGVKVYVVPKSLSKGVAINRFRKYINSEYVISAGDSEFDVSMLIESDLAFAPCNFIDSFKEIVEKSEIDKYKKIHEVSGKKIFAEEFLESMLLHLSDNLK